MPSSQDYAALEATTSIEEMTEIKFNQETLRSLKNDELPVLWLCDCDIADDAGNYHPGSSEELGWMGHFAKKSAHLGTFGMSGSDFLQNCSERSIRAFFEDLGKCSYNKLSLMVADLTGVADKMGPAMKKNSITVWEMEGCYMRAPEANYLFNAFQGMNNLEKLYFSYADGSDYYLDDGIMARGIPSLAACTAMKDLDLWSLDLGTNSCAALSAVLPRMASLRRLSLSGNLIDDNCVEDLVRGLSECKQLHKLDLENNMIGDDGLALMIEGLPSSVDELKLRWNAITLARQLSLSRFKILVLSDNPLSPGGPLVIAASLADAECLLEELDLRGANIGDEGAAILAESLRDNRKLFRLSIYASAGNITEAGWRNAFLPILCNTASANAVHGSNHTLQYLRSHLPQDIDMFLKLNSNQDKSRVAAEKILQAHRHLDITSLIDRNLELLPYVVMWFERFAAKSRHVLKLSLIFESVRATPMDVVLWTG